VDGLFVAVFDVLLVVSHLSGLDAAYPNSMNLLLYYLSIYPCFVKHVSNLGPV
jgi:hypothetical protein